MLTESQLIERATGPRGKVGSSLYQKWRLARKALGLNMRPEKLPPDHRKKYMKKYMKNYRTQKKGRQ